MILQDVQLISFVIGRLAKFLISPVRQRTLIVPIYGRQLLRLWLLVELNYKYVAVIAGSTPLATAYGSSNTLVVDTNGGAIWLGMCM
jgi:hypothetical protein